MKYGNEKKISETLKSNPFIYSIVRSAYDHLIVPVRKSVRHKNVMREAEKRKKGYCDPRFEKIRALKGIYSGERCFIICTGPSLTLEDVNCLKNEYTFGMNSIYKLFNQTDFRPSYYGIIDAGVFDRFRNDADFATIENVLFPDFLLERCGEPPFRDGYTLFPFDYEGPSSNQFSDNAYIMVYDIATVTYALLQIAVYMGFTQIYLLGCDCNYSGEKMHYDGDNHGRENMGNSEQDCITAYKVAKQYADAHGITIYNATRGGKLEVFPRVDFDSLFNNTRDGSTKN